MGEIMEEKIKEENKVHTKKKHIILGIMVLECIITVALLINWYVAAKQTDTPVMDMTQWQSNYCKVTEEGCCAEEYMAEGKEEIDFLYGPGKKLKKGSYCAVISYETEADQSCLASANNSNIKYIRASTGILSKRSREVSYEFTLMEDVDNFELLIKYNGEGSFLVKDIYIVKNCSAQKRMAASAVIIVLLSFLIIKKAKKLGRTVSCDGNCSVSYPSYVFG